MAAFLQTSPTTLCAPRCPPRRNQTTCLTVESCETFRCSLAFAANARLPPLRRAYHPAWCLDTTRWHRNPQLFETSSHPGICVNGFSFYPFRAFDRRLAPRKPLISAFGRPPHLGRPFFLVCLAEDISSRPAAKSHL